MSVSGIKCNTCMQTIEITRVEEHIKNHHFPETRKDSISEKKTAHTLEISSIINTHVNNQFSTLSTLFKEKIFPRKELQSLNKLNETASHNQPSIKKHIELKPTTELVCNTCKKVLDSEICRIIITRNVDGEPQFFSFHFFAPCWNLEDFSQKHQVITLDKVVFSIPENIPMSENCIKDLQTNLSFWD